MRKVREALKQPTVLNSCVTNALSESLGVVTRQLRCVANIHPKRSRGDWNGNSTEAKMSLLFRELEK